MIQGLKRLGAHHWFAIGNVAIALVIGLAVFCALPARSLWIDAPVMIVLALLLASSAGLVTRARWASRITRAAGLALLAMGMIVTASLTLGMIFSRAMAGATAGPGLLVMALALLSVVPYALVYPACLLAWIDARGAPR
jgi:hypothetical protein